jgi:hypothetical protein
MAALYTIPEIIEIARVSGYLAQDDIAKGALYSPKPDPDLPILLYMVREAVDFQNGNDPAESTLRDTANYLFWLCGKYAARAQYIISSGGGGTVVVPGAAADGPIWIRITSADFANETDYVNTDVDGETFFLLGNWISRILYPETEWEYLAGGGFRILIDGFDSTAFDYEIYLVKRNLSSALANSVDWSNISGKPTQGVEHDLVANTLIPNLSAGSAFDTVAVTIIPNGYSYTWDTDFAFSDSCPEQPGAIGAGTMQVYTFQYILSQTKWVCVSQSINIPI